MIYTHLRNAYCGETRSEWNRTAEREVSVARTECGMHSVNVADIVTENPTCPDCRATSRSGRAA